MLFCVCWSAFRRCSLGCGGLIERVPLNARSGQGKCLNRGRRLKIMDDRNLFTRD